MSERQSFLQRKPLRRALANWLERHQHPFNRGIHLLGIPLAFGGALAMLLAYRLLNKFFPSVTERRPGRRSPLPRES